jgi:hypothetical protein
LFFVIASLTIASTVSCADAGTASVSSHRQRLSSHTKHFPLDADFDDTEEAGFDGLNDALKLTCDLHWYP